MATGDLHHLEFWVPSLERSTRSLGFLLESLGYVAEPPFATGQSWRRGSTYVVIEQSPAMEHISHNRLRPGLNHLAFSVETSHEVDQIVEDARSHGWSLLFADKHPHAGGEQCYAAYLSDIDDFEVELVAENV